MRNNQHNTISTSFKAQPIQLNCYISNINKTPLLSRFNKNIQSCLNCNSPFAEEDLFCSNCSQRRTDGLISVKDLFSDFFSTVFNIDGKLFSTIKDLFVPGKLTTAFFEGKQEKYYKPIRMFFVFMVTNLAILSLTVFSDENVGTDGIENGFQKIRTKKEAKEELDLVLTQQRENFNSSESSILLDSISANLEANHFKNMDSIPITELTEITSINLGFSDEPEIKLSTFKIAVDDIKLLENDYEKFSNKYEITGFLNNLAIQQSIKISANPKGTFSYVVGNMTWMLILLIPAIAFVFQLLYFRRKFYFVQHLAFLFHNHAFVFLMIALLVISEHYVTNEGFYNIAENIFWIVLNIYLFMAMKKFYGQSYFKTLLKYLIVAISYIFIGLIFFVLTILISFALFS